MDKRVENKQRLAIERALSVDDKLYKYFSQEVADKKLSNEDNALSHDEFVSYAMNIFVYYAMKTDAHTAKIMMSRLLEGFDLRSAQICIDQHVAHCFDATCALSSQDMVALMKPETIAHLAMCNPRGVLPFKHCADVLSQDMILRCIAKCPFVLSAGIELPASLSQIKLETILHYFPEVFLEQEIFFKFIDDYQMRKKVCLASPLVALANKKIVKWMPKKLFKACVVAMGDNYIYLQFRHVVAKMSDKHVSYIALKVGEKDFKHCYYLQRRARSIFRASLNLKDAQIQELMLNPLETEAINDIAALSEDKFVLYVNEILKEIKILTSFGSQIASGYLTQCISHELRCCYLKELDVDKVAALASTKIYENGGNSDESSYSRFYTRIWAFVGKARKLMN